VFAISKKEEQAALEQFYIYMTKFCILESHQADKVLAQQYKCRHAPVASYSVEEEFERQQVRISLPDSTIQNPFRFVDN